MISPHWLRALARSRPNAGRAPRLRVEELEGRLVPTNDLFAQAIELTGATAADTASNGGYTLEAGEPDHTGYGGVADTSAWWKWKAPAAGTTQVNLDGTDFGHVLNVYTGEAVNGLTRVSGVFGSADFGQAAVLFAAEAGKTYHFAVSGFDGGTGNIKLTLNQPAARPANDNFAAAEVFTGTADAATGTNVGATAEANEPHHINDSGSTNSASVWYTWTAQQSGVVTLDPTGTSFVAVVAVYTGGSLGSLGSLQQVLAQGTFPGYAPGRWASRFDAHAGQTYSFAVDSVSGRWGDISLSLTQNTTPPPNDNFASAQPIIENSVAVTGSNVGATGEAGEPNNAYYSNGPHLPSVWYKWTAPSSGAATVDLSASGFGASVGVYVGSKVGQLGRIISAQGYANPNGPGFSGGPVGFSATAGRTYYISVDGDAATEGAISLGLTLTPPPTNDAFATATAMTGREWTVDGTNVGATGESGEPDHADVTDPNSPQTSRDAAGELGSVWYEWTAPTNGKVTVQIPAAFAGGNTFGYSPALGVYTGGAVGTLTEVVSAGGYYSVPPLNFTAVAGTTYRFAVDGYAGTMGTFTLSVGYAPANDDFAAAEVIPAATAVRTVTGSTTHATSEPGDPANPYSPISNVWYSWTATASGTVTLRDAGGPASIGFQVFTGDALASLTSATPFAGSYFGDLSFEAAAGTTYRIAAAGDAQPGGFKFRFINTTAPGVHVDGGELFVFGTAGNDRVDVTAAGRAADGSTGVKVETSFGTRRLTFDSPITAASIYTGAGRDSVTLGGRLTFPVTAVLGAGDDTFHGGKGAATVFGDFADATGFGNDVISTGDGNDQVIAGGGNNTVAVGDGNNYVCAGDGNDVISGVNGFNYIFAGNGNNRVTVGDGGNTVITGSGDDVVRTGSGSDYVADAGGNNAFDLGAGDDGLDVTGGTVEYDYTTYPGTATVTLGRGVNVVNAGAGNDRVSILYSAGAAVVDGGSGDDTIVVTHGTNVLSGGAGDDVLIGGAGVDVISGGAGNDFLAGGGGRDVLSAGGGNDILFAGVFSVFNQYGQYGVVSAYDLGQTARQALDRWNRLPNTPQTLADVRTILSGPLSNPRAADGDRDTVYGDGGTDWFLGIDLDDRHDRKPGEFVG